ncbi:hypothetical protein AB0J72_58750 [Dactylosporangium sp. NPDC049742]|uniref:hypothetical protein n=1 Tax=Dactylosporangium sp. NPDC049742 TaxID=3154737 RepID=UPI00341CC566
MAMSWPRAEVFVASLEDVRAASATLDLSVARQVTTRLWSTVVAARVWELFVHGRAGTIIDAAAVE